MRIDRIVRKKVVDGEDRLWCPGCERFLPYSMYYKNSATIHGVQGYCVLCQCYMVHGRESVDWLPYPCYSTKSGALTKFELYFEELKRLGYSPVVPSFM